MTVADVIPWIITNKLVILRVLVVYNMLLNKIIYGGEPCLTFKEARPTRI